MLIRSSPTSSCLADHLADIAHDVFIYARSTEVVDSLNVHHRNPKYLKGEPYCSGGGRPPRTVYGSSARSERTLMPAAY
jgi:hypothetical protein